MRTLEQEIKENIKHLEKLFGESATLKEYEKTSQNFDNLVKDGFIKKRGYNLLSVSDKHLKGQVPFNTNDDLKHLLFNEDNLINYIDYIHELQNLFYSLTKDELILKTAY